MNVLLNTSPLQNDNSIRGVGVYTRYLSQELEKLENSSFQVTTSKHKTIGSVSETVNPDVIHYPFFDLFFHTLPFHFTKKQKIVVTIHDVIPLLFPNYYKVGIRGNINFALQKISLSNCDAVITDSQSSKNDLIKYLDIPEEKIHITYLAGNPNIRKADASQILAVRKKYNLPDKFLLYVGDINYNKNIPNMITALQDLDDAIHLVCVGKNFRPQSIPEWARIQEAIDVNKLEKRIHFIRKLSSDANEDLSAIYSLAACYVQPSYYEGFGLPVLEALQCGTRVVCAQNSSLIEVGGKVVEYTATDARSIATAIQNALTNPYYSSPEWHVAVTKHLQRFSWNITATQTLEVYKSLFASYD